MERVEIARALRTGPRKERSCKKRRAARNKSHVSREITENDTRGASFGHIAFIRNQGNIKNGKGETARKRSTQRTAISLFPGNVTASKSKTGRMEVHTKWEFS